MFSVGTSARFWNTVSMPTRARLGRVGEAPLDAVDDDPALVGLHRTRDHADERALAGAVVADDPEHLAAAKLQADVVERGHGAEPLRDSLHLEHDRPLAHRVASADGSAA